MIAHILTTLGGLLLAFLVAAFVASLFWDSHNNPDARIERERGRSNRP